MSQINTTTSQNHQQETTHAADKGMAIGALAGVLFAIGGQVLEGHPLLTLSPFAILGVIILGALFGAVLGHNLPNINKT